MNDFFSDSMESMLMTQRLSEVIKTQNTIFLFCKKKKGLGTFSKFNNK